MSVSDVLVSRSELVKKDLMVQDLQAKIQNMDCTACDFLILRAEQSRSMIEYEQLQLTLEDAKRSHEIESKQLKEIIDDLYIQQTKQSVLMQLMQRKEIPKQSPSVQDMENLRREHKSIENFLRHEAKEYRDVLQAENEALRCKLATFELTVEKLENTIKEMFSSDYVNRLRQIHQREKDMLESRIASGKHLSSKNVFAMLKAELQRDTSEVD